MTGFRPLTKVTAQWARVGNLSLEHLTLEQNADRITATAVIVSSYPQDAFGVWYNLFFDAHWRIKAVSVHRTDTHWFVAHSREPGSWTDGDGGRMKKFEGCEDVLLSTTPFTMTPIIRRLNLEQGDTIEQDVLRLHLKTLVPARGLLKITCLKAASRYRVQDATTGSEVDYNVDSDGLLLGECAKIKRLPCS